MGSWFKFFFLKKATPHLCPLKKGLENNGKAIAINVHSTQIVVFKISVLIEKNKGSLGRWMIPSLEYCFLQKNQENIKNMELYRKNTEANTMRISTDQIV